MQAHQPRPSRRKSAHAGARQSADPPPQAVTALAPTPLFLRINRESLAVFAAVATVEARPLLDVLEEQVAATAAHLSCPRPTLALDAREHAYLDSLEVADRIERMEEETRAGALATPAMERAAASDRREAMDRTEADDEADFWLRTSGNEGITVAINLED